MYKSTSSLFARTVKVGNSVRMDIILLLREGGEHRSDESLTAGSHNQTGFHPCAPTVASFILEQVESGVGGEKGTICLLALLQGCLANFPTQVCVNACMCVRMVPPGDCDCNSISFVSLCTCDRP